MNKKIFALLCGIIASSLFWLISIFSYQIGWKEIGIEYFLLAAGIMIVVATFPSFSLDKEGK